MNYISNLFNQNITPYKFSLLRIVFGFSVLAEYLMLIYQREVISEWTNLPLLILGTIFSLLVIVGFKTKFVLFLSWVLVIVNFSFFEEWEYHLDYGFLIINFLLIFFRTGEVFSIDSKLNSSISRQYNKYFYSFFNIICGT